jgi:hypothetical protein
MDHNKEIERLIRTEKRLQILKADTPRCSICGYDKPRSLERHHIAGHNNSETTVWLCRNCHDEISDRQEDLDPDLRSNTNQDPLLRQAAMLQGGAMLLLVLLIAFLAWSAWDVKASADLTAAYGENWYRVIAEPAPQ